MAHAAAGSRRGVRGAIQVDRAMQTGLPDVLAAGDCVITHHRLLDETYLPLGIPWEAVQMGAQAWDREANSPRTRAGAPASAPA